MGIREWFTRQRKPAAQQYDIPPQLREVVSAFIASNQELAAVFDKLPGSSNSLKDYLQRTQSTADAEIQAAFEFAGRGPDPAKNGSDLISSIINTKVDFYSAGFGVQLQKPGEGSGAADDPLAVGIKAFMLQHEVRKVCEDLIFDLAASNNAILVWAIAKKSNENTGIKSGGIEYLMTIPAWRVSFQNFSGKEVLKVKLTSEMTTDILGYVARKEQPPYPQKYIDAAMKGTPVQLKNDDGEYWIVRSDAPKFSGLARPTMRTIFLDILMRDLLAAGDFSVAYFIKNLIQHVKAGESNKTPGGFGTTDLYLSEPDKKNLYNIFKTTGQALLAITNHTVEIDYKFPDPAVFNPEKYSKVEERIFRWGGVPDVLMTGQGNGYAQGSIGKSRFEAHGKKIRASIGWMWQRFFSHESVMAALDIPVGATCSVQWDEQVLREWKEILDQLRLQLTEGGMDWQTVHETLGFDHESIRGRKEREHAKEKEVWTRDWEAKQGLGQDGCAGGRPAEGTPKNTGGRPSRGE